MSKKIKQSQYIQKCDQKVALVHDFLLYPGGAEKVLLELAAMYPKAPIYTLLYDEEKMGSLFVGREVRTSFLQSWPQWIRKHYRWLLPFYGSAIEALDLRSFDLVISSSSAWSKGLVTRLNTTHFAYIHSPMRYVWDENERYMKRIIKRPNFVLRQVLSYLRVWDHQAAQRPDYLIANSQYTKRRIEKYYRKTADVIHPPVCIPKNIILSDSHIENIKKSFIIISRLSVYKNVMLAVQVCNKLQLPLIVVGDGAEQKEIMQSAGDTIDVRGFVSEEEKWRLLHDARALLFPCEDDFGIVCVEALLAGTPVIALGRGGASEIVRDGVDGIIFDAPVIEVMADGVRRFLEQEDYFDHNALQVRARSFSSKEFRTRFEMCVQEYLEKNDE